MKVKRLAGLRPVALVALGVFLGRGAQADTVLDFELIPPGQPVNDTPGVLQTFGDNAAASSAGVTVTGFGTPNIGLRWAGIGFSDTRWDFYHDGGSVWNATQLNDSAPDTSHILKFTPNSAAARVVIKSFNFHPYYISTERFTYNVSVLAGTNVVSGPTNLSFVSDSAKHLVSLNYTGALGQTLKLRLDRLTSTLTGNEVEGNPYDIAVDDITFAQLPEAVVPVGPQVVSVSPADDATGLLAAKVYSASITNGATTVVAGSIQLKLDGSPVSPPPTISSGGGLTNVSYQSPGFLAAGSTHVYTLTYNDNLGSNYTSEAVFTVANYLTLPAAYAIPPGAGAVRGFTARTVSANGEATALDSTIARAKAQLAGTLTNQNTSLPYANAAAIGPNPGGSFNYDTVLNFADIDTLVLGNFTNDVTFPGLPTGPSEWFATEASLYLELPVGYHRFGVNSDDGFEVAALAPQGVAGSPLVLGFFDNGRGADDTFFDFLAQASGLYSFKLVYFESTGYANVELFSVNLADSQRTLINDTNANAIVSYRALKPFITGIAKSGSNAVIDWAYGTPPFQVQFKTNVTDAVWSNLGSPTPNRTANVPIQSATGFIRVRDAQP